MPDSARWLLAVSALAVAAAGAPAVAAAPSCPSGAFRVSKRWVETDLPKFPRATAVPNDRVMTHYAADVSAPGRLFVTDGETVFRSTDYGCTWKQVYQVAVRSAAMNGTTTQTHSIQGVLAPGGNRVYLVHATGWSFDGAQELLVSTDGGQTFTPNRMPWANLNPGYEGVVVPAPSDPKRVYVLRRGGPGLVSVTKDGGATWTHSHGLAQAKPDATGFVLTVDPQQPDVVYAFVPGTAGLYRSTDAATTWKEISPHVKASGPRALAVVRMPGAPELIASDGTVLTGCNADCSRNGAVPGPKGIDTFVVTKKAVYAAAGNSPMVYNPRTGAATFLTVPYGGARHLQTDFAAKPSLYMATDHNLYRYLG